MLEQMAVSCTGTSFLQEIDNKSTINRQIEIKNELYIIAHFANIFEKLSLFVNMNR